MSVRKGVSRSAGLKEMGNPLIVIVLIFFLKIAAL